MVRDKVWFWGSFGSNDIKNRTGGADAETPSRRTTPSSRARRFKANAQFSGIELRRRRRGTTVTRTSSAATPVPTRPAPDDLGPTWPHGSLIKFEDTHVFNSNFFLSAAPWSKVDGGFSLTSQGGHRLRRSSSRRPGDGLGFGSGVVAEQFPVGAVERVRRKRSRSTARTSSTPGSRRVTRSSSAARHAQLRDGPVRSTGPAVTSSSSIWRSSASPPARTRSGWSLIAARRRLVSQDYTSFWAAGHGLSLGDLTANVGLRYDLQEARQRALLASRATRAVPRTAAGTFVRRLRGRSVRIPGRRSRPALGRHVRRR